MTSFLAWFALGSPTFSRIVGTLCQETLQRLYVEGLTLTLESQKIGVWMG